MRVPAILLLLAVRTSAVELLSDPGPTFWIPAEQLPDSLVFVAYGDQRFTTASNSKATNPRVRKWLVDAIAREQPNFLLMTGDIPLNGDSSADYAVFQAETKPWRDSAFRVFPALGNHELRGDLDICLGNWWKTFPELRNRRWYSAQLGKRVYVIALDSDTSLLASSSQGIWFQTQIQALPPSIDFVFILMHHPPVADEQQHTDAGHNARPNEIAVRDFLTEVASHTHARFIVAAGHIHNYERNIAGDVTYLVSGGGGAKPVIVDRAPEDQFQSTLFPNYHYVKLVLSGDTMRGTMYRVVDPAAATLAVEAKDAFQIVAKPRSGSSDLPPVHANGRPGIERLARERRVK